MIESILIVVAIMVFCGLLFSPFHFIGRKKRSQAKIEAQSQKNMSKGKSALYLAIEATLCIAFFLYLMLKGEMVIPATVSWLVYIGLAIAIGMEFKRAGRL